MVSECSSFSGGSHEKAFNQFIYEVLRPIKQPHPKDVTKLRTTYGNFKNLRALADYKPELISQQKADETVKFYKSLSKEINII